MARNFIVYADGGSRGNPGPAAFGAVVIEGKSVIAEIAEPIGVASNNVAEYSGLIAGLRAANELDQSATIEVRMDSKLVIEQMSGRWQIKHPGMRKLATEARDIHSHQLITYKWIPREENSHADSLVNKALDGDIRTSASRQINFLSERMVSNEPPTTIYLIRHGETHLTPERRFSGSGGSDPELSEKGLSQAKIMAKQIASRKIDLLISSPLKRAAQTAEAISSETGIKYQTNSRWVEVEFGEWDELTVAETKKLFPAEWESWVSDTSFVPGKTGESFAQLSERVELALREIEEDHPGKTIAVVTHYMVIKALAARVLEAPLLSIFHLEVSPCGIVAIKSWPSDGLRALVVDQQTI